MSWQVADEVAWVSAEDGAVVYAMRLPDGQPAILRDGLAVIWQLVVEGADPLELADEVAQPERAIAERGIRQTLADLVELGLVEEQGSGDSI